MDKNEYNQRLFEIKKRFEEDKKQLAIECAASNNPYSVGDILKDDSGVIILVERILFSYGYGEELPYCVYEGKTLKKDLTPRKVKPFKETVAQMRVVAKLN